MIAPLQGASFDNRIPGATRCALFDWVRRNIRYTRDIFQVELLHTARRMIELKAGDCDDMTILLGAMLMSTGHPVRLALVGFQPHKPHVYTHIYPEVNVGKRWIALDATMNRPIGWAPPALCTVCGVPFDAQYFDVSNIVDKPEPGETAPLAEFEMPPQYCGVLEYFAQFTNEYPGDNSLIETPDIEWLILADGSPLFPYLSFRHIVNPWGEGAFPVAVRLPEGATIRFIARGVSSDKPTTIERVGGRLLGRFWYNATYGDAARR